MTARIEGLVFKNIPDPRPHLRPDGIPTRCDQALMSAAELKITEAMHAVEEAGASPELTYVVTMLAKARGRVADHVEGIKHKTPEDQKVRGALVRARTILRNMAKENVNPGLFQTRWPISHEPLRADARGLLPTIDEALGHE